MTYPLCNEDETVDLSSLSFFFILVGTCRILMSSMSGDTLWSLMEDFSVGVLWAFVDFDGFY